MSRIPGTDWNGAAKRYDEIVEVSHPTISSAILASVSGQSIRLEPGIYHIDESIVMKPGVSLDMSGSKIVLDSDMDVFICAPGANIRGGAIDCSGITFTKSVFLFDGAKKFGIVNQTVIQDIALQGNWQTDGGSGIGVKFIVTQSTTEDLFVSGVRLSNLGINFFQTGVLFSSIATSGAKYTTLNGNVMTGLSIVHCQNGIVLDQEVGTNIDGNVLSNIQIQYGSGSGLALNYILGTFNSFTGIMVWDWPGDYPIEFAGNYSILSTPLYVGKIHNTGYNNQIVAITP
jgi:hypothetical protein